MNIVQLLEVSHHFMIAACWLLSMTLYFRKAVPPYLKLFPPYMSVTFGVSLAAYWMAVHWGNNHVLYNLYSTFAFAYLFYILLLLLEQSRVRTVLMYLDCIFIVFEIGYFCFIDIKVFNPFLFLAGSVLILFHCFMYLRQLFNTRPPVPLHKEPSFWICLGLLWLYGGMMTLMHANRFLHIFPRNMLKMVLALVYVTNDIGYFLLSISFLCVGNVNKRAR